MNNTDFENRYSKKMLLASLIGLLVACISVALVSVLPLYNQLKIQQANSLNFAAKTRIMVVEEFLEKSKETARQFTSRSKIREFLEKYNRGEINLARVSNFSTPKMRDALSQSEVAVGINRLSISGVSVVEIGVPIPQIFLHLPDPDEESLVINGPISIDDKAYIVIAAPILNRKKVRVGVDIVLFDIAKLKDVVRDYTGLGTTGETILGGLNEMGQPELFFEVRSRKGLEHKEQEKSHLMVATEVFQNGISQQYDAEIHQVDMLDDLASYGSIKGIGWKLMVIMNKDEVFESITKQVVNIALVIIVLIIPLGLLGLTLLLRPFSQQISSYVKQLQQEVNSKELAVEELVQVEHIISDDRERLSVTLNSLAEGVISTDIDGYIVSINQAAEALTGCSYKDAIGKSIDDVFHIINVKTGERCVSSIDRALEAGLNSDWKSHSILTSQDGAQCHIENRGVPIRDSDGTIIGAVLVFRDITQQLQDREEQERLQRELHQSQKMDALGNLTGGIAHDFNNILSIIMGNTELAQMSSGMGDGSKMHKYLETIQNASTRARDLVAQMMVFSRNDQVDSRPSDLSALVKEDMKMLRSTLPSTIEIELDYQKDLPQVMMDPVKLQQIVINLCVNAKDAMDGAGTLSIWIGLTRDVHQECTTCHEQLRGDWVEIAITDNGSGIPEGEIERIFEPFFTTKEVGKGTGMGLAVVDSTVKSFDGHIIVQSEQGKGTTFRLLFHPAQTTELPKVDEIVEQDIVVGSGQSILIVDDEPELVAILSEMLEAHGYSTTSVSHSPDALQRFEQNPAAFNLVITDQTMPELNGSDMAARMRELNPAIPIILATGYSDSLGQKEAEAQGVSFMRKPIQLDVLTNMIADLLSKHE